MKFYTVVTRKLVQIIRNSDDSLIPGTDLAVNANSNLVHNERLKLVATTLNNLGIASMVTGVVAPVAGFIYGVGQPVPRLRLALAVVAWLVVGLGLHLISQQVLRRLRE